MIRTFLIPLLAIAGILFGVYTVVKSSRPKVAQPPLTEPPRAPFESFVAGAALIEASTENIAIGTPVGGVITVVFVEVGQRVKRGDPLFQVDDKIERARYEEAMAALRVAEVQQAEAKAAPRAEDLPPLEARLAEADADLNRATWELETGLKANEMAAISEDELTRRRYGEQAARARRLQAEAQLNLMRSGTWAPVLAVAEARVLAARATAAAARAELERRIVRAPVDGEILQSNVRLGEFAVAGPSSEPLVLMGDTTLLHARVDVDEHDAWRVKQEAPARAFIRGNKQLKMDLRFVRFEPFIVPKRSLTGDSRERVDTRVLQVLYSFERPSFPVYVGQQLDVYIEAAPLAEALREPPPPAVPTSTPTADNSNPS
ncbi:MAG: biotin/lipoyl-binding protein [Planctomycetota bacterium]|nr:biotin/lipoyl-binding protein [Planctomycetota bacterium]